MCACLCGLGRLQSEYEYSSVVDHARALLTHCKARTAVRARIGDLDFLRAPDASCSSILLFAAGDAPTPVMLGDRAKFLEFLGVRMAAARAECKEQWSVAFFLCDGPNLYGGLKVCYAFIDTQRHVCAQVSRCCDGLLMLCAAVG